MGGDSLFPVTLCEESRTYKFSNKGCAYRLSISASLLKEISFDIEARSKFLGRCKERNFRLGLDQASVVARALVDLASGAHIENRFFSFVWGTDVVDLDIGRNTSDEIGLRINHEYVWGDKSVVLPLGQHARVLGEALRDLIRVAGREA